MARHCAWSTNRFSQFRGNTAFGHIFNVDYNSELANFGERIQYMVGNASNVPNHSSRCRLSWWLGRSDATDEHVVADCETGASMLHRTAIRLSPGTQFNRDVCRIQALP